MSKPAKISITCPSCQANSDFIMWESINTVLDPEMKSAVRDRSAFLFTCPNCGAQTYTDYGFLYHQMEDHIMIHYAYSDENAEEAYNIYSGKDMPDMMQDMMQDMLASNYLIRIVRSQNQLREKLAIFDHDLDDRIVELFKIFVLAQYQEDHPEHTGRIELLYFYDDGKHLIQLLDNGEPAGVAEMPLDIYNRLTEEFSTSLPDMRKDEPFIDRYWAERALGLNKEEA